MIDLSDIMIATLFTAFIMLWWNAQGVKQIALDATRRHCKKMDILLLDDGLVLKGFWLKRDQRGNLRLWRSYTFEFSSTGHERYSGQITLLGRFIEDIHLEPHRLN